MKRVLKKMSPYARAVKKLSKNGAKANNLLDADGKIYSGEFYEAKYEIM